MKNTYIKVLSISLILFIMLASLPGNTGAANEKQRIFDDAGLLTNEETRLLEEIAHESSVNRETDFIILTTEDADGKKPTKYMQDKYDDMGFGYDKKHGNTAILIISMLERDVELDGFYKAETYLDDDRLDMIRHKITPDLSNESYFSAFETFIKTGDKYMGYRPGVNPENILFKWWFQIIMSLGIASIALGSMIYNSGGRVTTNARTYRDSNRSRILKKRDRYLRKTVTKRRKPKPSKSRGGRGGGGGGMTSGGHSHSGSRGKF